MYNPHTYDHVTDLQKKAPRQFPGERNWFPTPFPQQMMLKQLSNLEKTETLTS